MVGWGPCWGKNQEPFQYVNALLNFVHNRSLQESFEYTELQQSEKMLYQAMQRPEYYVVAMSLQSELTTFKSQHPGATVPPDTLRVNTMSCKFITNRSNLTNKTMHIKLFSQHLKQKIKIKNRLNIEIKFNVKRVESLVII